MEIHFIILLLKVAYMCGYDIEYYDLNKAPEMFQIFVIDYNKVYKDLTDLINHYEAFKNNLKLINESNRINRGLSKICIDEFSDMTTEEKEALEELETMNRAFTGTRIDELSDMTSEEKEALEELQNIFGELKTWFQSGVL